MRTGIDILENELVGTVIIDGVSNYMTGDITFSIDENGILNVAVSSKSGSLQSLKIQLSK